jgi:hypothetical protein
MKARHAARCASMAAKIGSREAGPSCPRIRLVSAMRTCTACTVRKPTDPSYLARADFEPAEEPRTPLQSCLAALVPVVQAQFC